MNRKDIAALFVLAALFGSSFLFVRIASPVIGPYLTAQGRVTFAAFGLLVFVLSIGQSTQFKQRWKQYFMIGALNSAIPFTLVSFASLQLNASMLAIINSMTPLFTALVAWGWLKDRLTLKKSTGILLGIIGVIVTVGWSPITVTVELIAASICSLLSTLSYGFGGVYAKRTFAKVPAASVAYGQLMGATLLLIPLTTMNLPEATLAISPVLAFSVAGLGLFSTALGYLLYYYLIESVGPTKTVTVTYLIPLFGMVWGVVFLKEQITAGMLIGLFVILSSIFLISDIQPARKKLNGK